MALNFQDVLKEVQVIGTTSKDREKTLKERREKARKCFQDFANRPEFLKQLVEKALEVDSGLRCAVPLKENLDAIHPQPALPEKVTLIAADGSQISPSRHDQVLFGLLNVGAIILQIPQGFPPKTNISSDLLFDSELYEKGNLLSDGIIALRRDLRERSKLEELANVFEEVGVPTVTFTDGPVELWGGSEGEDAAAFHKSRDEYKGVLSRLQAQGVITAGYVDKPSANLVVRLLELACSMPDEWEKLREISPLMGVTDRWLFGERDNSLLKPGERSAVFAIQSKNARNYAGLLSVHFFYLNVGTERQPWPVRVEIPGWVANDDTKLDILHASLLEQCRRMGAKPYPYLLHRAHELAVVTREDKKQIELMLISELRRNGSEIDSGPSYKQTPKDHKTR